MSLNISIAAWFMHWLFLNVMNAHFPPLSSLGYLFFWVVGQSLTWHGFKYPFTWHLLMKMKEGFLTYKFAEEPVGRFVCFDLRFSRWLLKPQTFLNFNTYLMWTFSIGWVIFLSVFSDFVPYFHLSYTSPFFVNQYVWCVFMHGALPFSVFLSVWWLVT